MPKWIDEKVLQKYWIDRCNHTIYEINGKKIQSAIFNNPFDRYPDVRNRLDDGTEVPAEIEWKTSDFNHEIDVLKAANGFLIVYHKDQNFSLPQLIIDHKDFTKWFKRNSRTLLNESLKAYHEETARRNYPKIWLRYNDAKNNKNMEISLQTGYDGFPEKTKGLPRIKNVQKNDLILDVGPYKSLAKGGRVPLDEFKGYMKKVILFRVTKGYHFDEKPLGWKSRDGEIYPHRFCISKPLIEFENLELAGLSRATRADLHRLVAQGFWEIDPAHFVELLSHVSLLQSQIVNAKL